MTDTQITQADREAAWNYRPSCYKVDDYTKWMAGNYDMATAVIGGFARHRTTHPPATDVAALVEAAKAVLPFMAQMRGGMCMKIDGKIVDAGSAHHALSAALAPFTKGQNDG